MNKDISIQGRKLFEERLKFGKEYIVYRSEHDAVAHALMDGHTHLVQYSSTSPRFFFKATQGSSGKTAATQLSSFFVQSPILVTDAGAGLIREVNYAIMSKEPLPTILYDEVQEVFGPKGNPEVYSLLNSYTKSIPRIITGEDGKPIRQSLFCPVIMNGLIQKYEIPGNFLERCIQIELPKRLPEEEIKDFDFDDLVEEIGNSFRVPRAEWAQQITKEEIKTHRVYVRDRLKKEGIHIRNQQLWRPLAEYAILLGAEVFEKALAAAKYSVSGTDVKRSLNEELLLDCHEIFSTEKTGFIKSETMVESLINLPDRPWGDYKRTGITAHAVAYLLRDYGVKPSHNPQKTHRGYHAVDFNDHWKRLFNLKPLA